MTKVMQGVRVLEVAQFTFVPAAGGILTDWGADVIKIEHPVRGDTQRGFVNLGGQLVRPPVQFDHAPIETTRSPQASEHTESFVMELGLERDRIESLKAQGVVA